MDKVRKIGIYKDIGIILFVFSVGLIISVVVSGIFLPFIFLPIIKVNYSINTELKLKRKLSDTIG